MTNEVDLAIIGAGPSGLSAAVKATGIGLKVALLDENETMGGQIYRNIEGANKQILGILGEDYEAGLPLVKKARASDFDYIPKASVWQVTGQELIFYSQENRCHCLKAKHIIFATGAVERPMLFPGWELPGVMSVGSGQIALKSSGLVPEKPVVLIGSGPLLYILAEQYLRSGVDLKALVATSQPYNFKAALAVLRHLGSLWKSRVLIARWLLSVKKLRDHNVPMFKNAHSIHATGEGKFQHLSFKTGYNDHHMDAELLLTHQGVIPNIEFSRALELKHYWNELERAWLPKVNEWGITSDPDIAIVGDGAEIIGSKAAYHSGAIAAIGAAYKLGMIDLKKANAMAVKHRKIIKHERKVRQVVARIYPPSRKVLIPKGETIVCRCESMTSRTVQEMVKFGASRFCMLKSFCRPGMGACQGRQCEAPVGEIISNMHKGSGVPEEPTKLRPPIRPLTLGELSGLHDEDKCVK